jgi:hypothetical protein
VRIVSVPRKTSGKVGDKKDNATGKGHLQDILWFDCWIAEMRSREGCSTVIEHLLQHCYDDTRMVTAYPYFDFEDTQKQDPELMLRSLLCQFLQRFVARALTRCSHLARTNNGSRHCMRF